MIGPNGEEKNCFFIACRSKPSVFNNADVLWCAKKESRNACPHVGADYRLLPHASNQLLTYQKTANLARFFGQCFLEH